MAITVPKFIRFFQQQITEKLFQIFCIHVDAFVHIRIICTDKSITEIPAVLFKRLIVYIKTKRIAPTPPTSSIIPSPSPSRTKGEASSYTSSSMISPRRIGKVHRIQKQRKVNKPQSNSGTDALRKYCV